MITNNILTLINESYIFSNKTISVDLDKFESGEINKLLISGFSGSGKTVTGNYLSKKYNVPLYDTDTMEGSEFVELLSNNNKLIISGVKISKKYREDENVKPIIIKQSFIFLGKSALKAAFDGWNRNRKKENNKYSLYDSIKDNFTRFYEREITLKTDRCNIPNSKIEEFKFDYKQQNDN